jgi:hypothetical protein
VALIEDHDAKLADVNSAEARVRDAWAAYRGLSKELAPILKGFQHAMRNLFGEGSEVLSDFGIAPRRAKPSVETQAAAVKKREATRLARHTMGPKEKAKIKGAQAPERTPAPKA